MRNMEFSDAVDDALAQSMARDSRIVVFGEDVPTLRRNLLIRFGEDRVFGTPISESAFLGAAVTAAMAGLRPVVEIMLVDFIAVAFDAVLNHAAKIEAFSGGKWRAPMVIRTSCGGGYGDGGQHEQCLWGLMAHIPGLAVVVPSAPEDAGSLMTASLEYPGPVVFMEHKLLAQNWLDLLGYGGRKNITFDVPRSGAYGPVPDIWRPFPIGKAICRREGKDLTIVSLGVSVHRSLQAAALLSEQGVSACVIDLCSVVPIDKDIICKSVKDTGRLLVVDEDYRGFGLSGELAAIILEEGIKAEYSRVCTQNTIPFSFNAENSTLPNVARITDAALKLMGR